MVRHTATPIRTPIDARRRLVPRDYAIDSYAFGERPQRFVTPPGGDDVSCEIARIIHDIVRAYRSQPEAPSGAELARRFGFSRQTWSRVTRGQQWPGHTVMAAMIRSLSDARPGPTSAASISREASTSR